MFTPKQTTRPADEKEVLVPACLYMRKEYKENDILKLGNKGEDIIEVFIPSVKVCVNKTQTFASENARNTYLDLATLKETTTEIKDIPLTQTFVNNAVKLARLNTEVILTKNEQKAISEYDNLFNAEHRNRFDL